MDPRVELLQPPEGYGTATDPLTWETVRAELENARQYWLAIPRTDGSPHVVPLDGTWRDDVWNYGGSPETLHRKLVAVHPHVTMHLPDPWRAIIVEGDVRITDNDPDRAKDLAGAFEAKYPEYGKADPALYAQSLGLHPKRVLAWTNFPTDMTRFLFD